MRIITDSITIDELKRIAPEIFGNLVKAVVDVDREILAVSAELHADLEALLLGNGSKQKDLWGINLYPELPKEEFIEYDSMINLRPSQGNRTRGVQDPGLQKKIVEIVGKRVRQ